MNPQLEGVEAIPGTYPFDVRTSVARYRINRFLWKMADPAHRAAFLADERAAMTAAGLDETEQQLIGSRDWIGLIRYGAIFFVVEKFARVAGKTNLEVYAMMRGESFEDFMKTRRVPDAR